VIEKDCAAFYVEYLNLIFIKDYNYIESNIDGLIVEINHYLIYKNTPQKIKNYYLKSEFGIKIENEKIDIENNNLLYFIDDSITNYFSDYIDNTNTYIINSKGLDYIYNCIKNKLKNNQLINIDNIYQRVKYFNYGPEIDYLFNLESKFMLYLYKHYGWEKIHKMIYALYNKKYEKVDDILVPIFNKTFKKMCEEMENE